MADVIVERNGLLMRQGTGLMIFRQGANGPELLVGPRAGMCPPEYQLPQGGLDEGLTHEQNAYKEADEELGLKPRELYFVGLTPTMTSYVLPKKLRENNPRKFDGQEHRWAVFRYIGEAELPDLRLAKDREFSQLRWSPPMWVVAHTGEFRVKPYETAIPEALALLKTATLPNKAEPA